MQCSEVWCNRKCQDYCTAFSSLFATPLSINFLNSWLVWNLKDGDLFIGHK